jgi:hypothetical protein
MFKILKAVFAFVLVGVKVWVAPFVQLTKYLYMFRLNKYETGKSVVVRK